MNNKGRSFEVIKPTWTKQAITSGIYFIISLALFTTNAIFFQIIAVALGIAAIYQGRKSLQLSMSAISFFEKGIQIKRPNHALEFIPINKIDNYDWEAETEEEIEENWGGSSVTTTHKITVLVSYENDNGEFNEINWTEEFPAGSISRLRRASERAAELFQDSQDQDDFYDE